jgi:hypothetical protein
VSGNVPAIEPSVTDASEVAQVVDPPDGADEHDGLFDGPTEVATVERDPAHLGLDGTVDVEVPPDAHLHPLPVQLNHGPNDRTLVVVPRVEAAPSRGARISPSR